MSACGHAPPKPALSEERLICQDIRTEVDRLFAKAKHADRETSAQGWKQLALRLEEAQLQSCRIETKHQAPYTGEQAATIKLGNADLECVKPSGARAYFAVRDLPPQYYARRVMRLTSYPPHGPTIQIDKATAEFPEIVQRFMHARACEAFRQGFRMNADDGTRYASSGNYNCAAIRLLRDSVGLTEEQFGVILVHARENELSTHFVVRVAGSGEEMKLHQALIKCFRTDAGLKFED